MMPFITVERYGIQKIIYYIYDADKDGTVSIVDLLFLKSNVSENTQFGQEINKLINEYYTECIEKKVEFDKRMFDKLLPLSCLGTEILMKIFDHKNYCFPKIIFKSVFTESGSTTISDLSSKKQINQVRIRTKSIAKAKAKIKPEINKNQNNFAQLFDNYAKVLVKPYYDRINKDIFKIQ